MEIFLGASAMSGFMPHGMCFLWTPWILWTHVASDLVTGLAYFSIPVVMALYALRRPDVGFRPVLYLFIAFILLCGATHFVSVIVIWNPIYEFQGVLKALTAIASLATAIALWPLLPKALAMPSTVQLEAKNAELAGEIERRRVAEAELTALTRSLEARVEERTEKLSQTNEALRQYAATASHDLQAPLRHISLFAQMLQKQASTDLSPGGQELIGNIVNSTHRMRRMIESLLEYSRLMDHELDFQTIDVAAPIAAAITAMKPDMDAAGAVIDVELDEALIDGDADLLSRLFENLLDNALKYRSNEPLRIHITSHVQGRFLEVSIADNGIGIEKEFSERVFEMLKRLHAESEIPGTGIGLSLCQRIAESHGGRIWLDQDYTGGACFRVALPLAEGGR